MAKIIRKVNMSDDGKLFVKINGLQLFPVTKVDVVEGDEVEFVGKNGKYKAADGTPWVTIELKKIESLFVPIGPKKITDQTENRVRLAVLKEQPVDIRTEWGADKIFKENSDLSSGIKIEKNCYKNGMFEFIYKINDNIIEYKIVKKPTDWQWSY